MPVTVRENGSFLGASSVADTGILDLLTTVPDPRHRRGVRHRFPVILALALSATCAGARSFTAIAEWAHDAPAEALGRLGVSAVVPSESTIRRTLAGVDAGEHTVAQIAGMLKVPRTTVYGHLDKKARRPPHAAPPEPMPPLRSPRICPTCGHEPTTRAEAAHQRADLAVTWLHPDPDHRGTVTSRHHCRHCEPGQPVFDIACSVCGDGPILADQLAELAMNGDLIKPVQRWLAAAGWTVTPDLLCPDRA
ncbi:transposase family protein [Rhodococcus koreensis]|nr:transposase family protein [Rhodococcus koreensis]